MRAAVAILALAAVPAAADEAPPWNAADAYYGAEAMAKARAHIRKHHGGQNYLFALGERLEYQSNEGEPLFLWDAQGWYGGDVNRFWVKTEGEYLFDESAFEEAEVQALYSRAVTPFFDLQAGLRWDFAPDPDTAHAVIGVEGLAPYWFEIDAAAFVSEDGDVSARIEAEYEILFTQRLILQPRTELEFAVQDVPARGIGSGLRSAELGGRLRYEIVREIAPYVGVEWSRAVGETADFARSEGEGVSAVSVVAGLRLWF